MRPDGLVLASVDLAGQVDSLGGEGEADVLSGDGAGLQCALLPHALVLLHPAAVVEWG